jgi:hypothetical protein
LNVNEEIDKLLNDFGAKWANDLKTSLDKALKDGAKSGERVQTSRIEFVGGVKYYPNKVIISITPNEDYWYYIENGRKKGKQPPTKVLGEKWQAKNGISPSKILYQMTIDYNQKKGFTKRIVKKLPFQKAAKQFAFIVARAIGKNGIKPKPFIDRVTEDGRKDELAQQMGKLIGKAITVTDIKWQ